MADVERLLSEYIAEHRAGGEADPVAYLDRAEGADRAELVELIDAYLERSPGREWDAAAYKGSEAERVADAITRSLAGESGWWPLVLPRFRAKLEMTRAAVVARLAEALGATGREEKVGRLLPRDGAGHARVARGLVAGLGGARRDLRLERRLPARDQRAAATGCRRGRSARSAGDDAPGDAGPRLRRRRRH